MKIIKYLAIGSSIIIIIYFVIVYIALEIAFGGFGPTYTKADLIQNYETHKTSINAVKEYVQSTLPKNKTVFIEFENEHTLSIFHVTIDGNQESNWQVAVKSAKADSLLNLLGWSKTTLTILKSKLDLANCISVSNGGVFQVGYQRSGMGMYFYNLFDEPLTDSLKAAFNGGCTHIYYKDNVVLEYGGGAFGRQCFEDYYDKK